MCIKYEDLLKKLKIRNILDLAVIAPHKYEDNYISRYVNIGGVNVIDAVIKSILVKRGNSLRARVYSKNLKIYINTTIFNPKPNYHYRLFRVNNNIYLKGVIEKKGYNLYITQPKVVVDINTILAVYKTDIMSSLVVELMKKYLSRDKLLKSNLPAKYADNIFDIHNPTREFLDNFTLHRGFSKESIEALKFTEAFNYMNRLSKKKSHFLPICKLNGSEVKFIKSLPFKLTDDQKMAIKDIKKDFRADIATRRMVVGDVGSGKTMVILASAMMAYPKKSILMAPTTLLAKQLYEEANKYLPKDISTILITTKNSKKDIKIDDFSLIIGTHALLYRQDLPISPLVMVDEQHRFGAQQRKQIQDAISKRDKRPHFIQFSATPIPRTLSMMHSGIINYSFIKEIPYEKDITTKLIYKSKEDFQSLLEHIKNEISKNHQTIIVYPLVEKSSAMSYKSISEGEQFWMSNFDNVFVTYGKDTKKNKTMEDFKKSGNILIATTLIEVGISLPKLTTIVIIGAERLGLATLHQLRGRVSRNGLKGYCFLFTKEKKIKRLKDFVKTSSGFDIADLDLKYRKSGDILTGSIQSGKEFRWLDIKEDTKIIEKAKQRLKEIR